jgi:membrane protease YdiL (CAAX protease family)
VYLPLYLPLVLPWLAAMDDCGDAWPNYRRNCHTSVHHQQLPCVSCVHNMGPRLEPLYFGVTLMALAYVVVPAVATANPRALRWHVLLSVGGYNYSMLLGDPLFEEPGWRGYALPRLEAALGPVRGSVLLALLQAGWHLPMFFYPGWITAPPWTYVLILIGVTTIRTYATNPCARFAVVTQIVMHAVFNTASRYSNGMFADTKPHEAIPFELVPALTGLAVTLALIIGTRGHPGYQQTAEGHATARTP